MAIDNYSQATLVQTITVDAVASDGTYTTPAIVLSEAFGSDSSTGGYVNSTTGQDDILVVRQFPYSTITDSNYNHTTSPITATEAWSVWTLPKTGESGSECYTLDTASNTITFKAESAVTSDGSSVWKWSQAMSGRTSDIVVPPIKAGDTIYIFRKTRTDEKSIQFQPTSKLTAASLNTAIDQAFRLGQENYALWHNFSSLNPGMGNPSGVCPLNSKAEIPATHYDADHVIKAVGTHPESAPGGTPWDGKQKILTNIWNASGSPGNLDAVNYYTHLNASNLKNYYVKGYIDTLEEALEAADNNRYTKSETDALDTALGGRIDTLTTIVGTRLDNLEDRKANLVNGVLDITELPRVAIAEFLTKQSDGSNPDNETEMLALTDSSGAAPQAGDWCIRDDNGRQYILGQTPSSVAANWIQLSAPTANVDSIITTGGGTETGAVTINASKLDVYTKAQVDANTHTQAYIASNFYTKTQVDTNTYTKTQVDANTYTRTHIDNTHYTKTAADSAIQAKAGSSVTGTVEDWANSRFLVSSGTDLNNLEVTATGGTLARDLDDHFGDWTNVKDFGAVGDGVNDDTSAIQAALNKKGVVLFPTGTYKVTDTLVWRSGTTIDLNGSTILFTSSDADTLFQTDSGTVRPNTVNLTNYLPLSAGQTDITHATLGADWLLGWNAGFWSENEMVRLVSTQPWYSGGDDPATIRYLSEFQHISKPPEGVDNRLVFADPLRYDYTDGYTLTMQFIRPNYNYSIRNGIIRDKTTHQNNVGFRCKNYLKNVSIENLRVENFNKMLCQFENCINVTVKDCVFDGTVWDETGDYIDNDDLNRQGITIKQGCENVNITGCTFRGYRTPIFTTESALKHGPSKDIRFTNNHCSYMKESSTADAASSGTEGVGLLFWYADNWVVDSCTMNGSETYGIYGAGGTAKITNNTFRETGTETNEGATADGSHSIAAIFYYNKTEINTCSIHVTGNTLYGTTARHGIWLKPGDASGASKGVGWNQGTVVSNNTMKDFRDKDAWAIAVGGSSANKVGGLTCHGNIVARVHNGIWLSHINESIISSNRLVCNADDGIAPNPDAGYRYGIYIEGLKDSIVNANSVIMNRVIAGSANRCIAVEGGDDTKGVSITSNLLEGCGNVDGGVDEGIYLNSDWEIWVSGNRLTRLIKGINYSPTIDKKKVRTFGNLFSGSSGSASVGDHGDGKEMDTGWAPQIEAYKDRTVNNNVGKRWRPENARHIAVTMSVLTSDITESRKVLPDPFKLNLTEIGIDSGNVILWSGITVVATDAPDDVDATEKVNLSKLKATLLGASPMSSHVWNNELEIVLSTDDGTAIKDTNIGGYGDITLQIALLVADSIESGGG